MLEVLLREKTGNRAQRGHLSQMGTLGPPLAAAKPTVCDSSAQPVDGARPRAAELANGHGRRG